LKIVDFLEDELIKGGHEVVEKVGAIMLFNEPIDHIQLVLSMSLLTLLSSLNRLKQEAYTKVSKNLLVWDLILSLLCPH
jgi:hypothetical protein